MFGLVIGVILVISFIYYHFIGKRKDYPPGPTPLPFIGNLLQFSPKIEPHVMIGNLAKKYGSVFTMWMGEDPQIVITDYEIIKDVLVKQGEILAGRPYNYIFTDLFRKGNYGVLFNDGQIWKSQRRFALHVLRDFGFGRTLMEEKINLEVEKLVDRIKGKLNMDGENVDLCPDIELTVINVISILLMGRTMDTNDKVPALKKKLDDFFVVMAKPELLLLQQWPILRYVPVLGHFGHDQAADVCQEFFDFLEDEVRIHEKDFDPEAEPTDYTGAFLKEKYRREKAGEDVGHFTQTQLNAALLDMWLAGMETTLTTMKWAIIYMLNHPDIQEKVHEEIHKIYEESNRSVFEMADRIKLPYTCAVITEIQRCANLLGINVWHRTLKDTYIGNQFVKSGTTIIPNMANVHDNEKYFPNPEKFDPTRYLGEKGKENAEMVIPFSLGKRSCLGESLARMELFLIFTGLIHNFKFSTPDGAKTPEPVVEFCSQVRIPKKHLTKVTIRG